MKEQKFTIPSEVEDWLLEYMEKEPDLSSLVAAIKYHQKTGAGPLEMGRMLAVGKAKDEVWDTVPEAKPMLNVGYAKYWTASLREQHETAELENGKKVEVRSLNGPVRGEDGLPTDDNPAYVDQDDPLSVSRAIDYTIMVIPGHVYNRLATIAAGQGDVMGTVDKLHDAIDEIAARLV